MVINATLRDKMIAALIKSRRKSMNDTDLDAIYMAATRAEKQRLMLSLNNNDTAAKDLIESKFNEKLLSAATAEVDGYIAQGSVPVAVVAEILNNL